MASYNSVANKKPAANRSSRLSPEAARWLPYPDFPLSPHLPTKRWYKVIRGTRRYFGPLDDPEAALKKYELERDYWYTGRTPPPDPEDGFTIADLVNEYLTEQDTKVEAGDLKPRTRREYQRACAHLVEAFGRHRRVDDLGPDDFRDLRAKLAKLHPSPVRLGVVIIQIRTAFNWGYDDGKIERPVKYGKAFNMPSTIVLRRHANAQRAKTFEPDEIKTLLAQANVSMRAAILLGINGGLGNTDIAELPIDAIDLDKGLLDYPRPKTEVQRRCTLWPETIEAIRKVLEKRPKPRRKADAHKLFITQHGEPWMRYYQLRDTSKHREEQDDEDKPGKRDDVTIDHLGREFTKLKGKAKVGKGRGFYRLRHTFETIAGETGDQKAVDFIMGHTPPKNDMGAHYRHWTGGEREQARLKRVTDHVHEWLYSSRTTEKGTGDGDAAD